MKVGDIYITKLKRDFYGAIRVLKTDVTFDFSDTTFVLLGVTNYIGKEKPELSNPKLTEILIISEHTFGEKIAIQICIDKGIKENTEYLGNIPLSKDEKNLKGEIGDGTDGGYPLVGVLSPTGIGMEVFWKWRWDNEPDIVRKEIEESRIRAEQIYRERIMKPKKMMADDTFWEIIALFDWNKNGNDDEVVKAAVEYLSKLKVADIKQFEENMTHKLFSLDTKEHVKNIGECSYDETDEYISVDSFLYARCATVANGRSFYERALKNPKEMAKDIEFEALLHLAGDAYERKMKKEFEYTAGCDYETYSNREGWM